MKFAEIRPFVRYARYMSLSRGESYAPMVNCDARLFYVTDGQSEVEVDGRCYEMEKGSLLVLGAGTHYQVKSPENHVSYIALNFDYTFNFSHLKVPVPPKSRRDFSVGDVVESVSFEDATELNGAVYLRGMHSLSGRLTSIEREYSMKVVLCETKISSLLCEVLCDVLRALRTESALGGAGKLDAILWYVHEHYRESLTNSRLGEHFGFHKNYVSALIKGYTGMPLHKYLNHVRLSHALDMLSGGERSISEIAAECGIHDVNYFIKLFKKQTGFTPKVFRENASRS